MSEVLFDRIVRRHRKRLRGKVRQITIDHSLVQTLIDQGIEHAKQFTWERAARTLLDVYEHVGAN